MPRQSIDTEKMDSTIVTLKTTNQNISRAFSEMERIARSTLQNNWNSSAGDAAFRQLMELLKGHESRETVLQNYINLLEQQVNPGYLDAEELNKSLASQFK